MENEVTALRDELDQRGVAQRRLAELDNADARQTRQQDIAKAEHAFETARAQADLLKTLLAELDLARDRRDTAMREHRQFDEALTEALQVTEESGAVTRRREDAVARRRATSEAIAAAQAEMEAAEADEIAARDLLQLIENAEKARNAAERRQELKGRLQHAESVRATIEHCDAQLAGLRLPNGAREELADLDVEIARIRAVQDAGRPSVVVASDDVAVAVANLTMGGIALKHGEERSYDGHAQLVAPGIGTITLRSNVEDRDSDRLERAESHRHTLLASMGVPDLAVARAQQIRVQKLEAQGNEARAQLKVIAPEGLDELRKVVAALADIDLAPIEVKADPVVTRATCEGAEQRRRHAIQTIRTTEPVRAHADDAFVAAETALASLRTREEQIAAILGPAQEHQPRLKLLQTALADREAALAEAQRVYDAEQAIAFDLDGAESALRRVRSVEQAAANEIQQLRETIAGLNARIVVRYNDAVEEKWREQKEALEAAEARVAAFGQELAVLTRLTQALEAARSDARDLYLKPVMTELRPLLGLLFDDVEIAFDDHSLLPQTIVRRGQEEDVDRLSGGMREQLSVLTRLAFARLLARDGRPAPVILDDALVYSDDDRIERMFDALHRQARDQQVIVFSCRQRAFQKLGGNALRMTDWQP